MPGRFASLAVAGRARTRAGDRANRGAGAGRFVCTPPMDAAAPGVPGRGTPRTGRVLQRRPTEPQGQGASSVTSSPERVGKSRSPLFQGENDRGKSQAWEPFQVFGTDSGASHAWCQAPKHEWESGPPTASGRMTKRSG